MKFEPKDRVQIVGHRGAMAHAPENTMAGFELALSLGADILELDIQMSKEGELVVIHDATVDRTTDGSGYVCQLTVEELKRLDAGAKFSPSYAGERVPTLDEVLTWARDRALLAIEIKSSPLFCPDIERRLVVSLRRHRMAEQVVVISFDHIAVKRVKELDGQIATGILYGCHLADPIHAARAALADAVHPNHEYLTAEEVLRIQQAGLMVSPWVIDDPAIMERFIAMGVDAIGTNRPDRLHQLLGSPPH